MSVNITARGSPGQHGRQRPAPLHQLMTRTTATCGTAPATTRGRSGSSGLVNFNNVHDFSACPPSPARMMPKSPLATHAVKRVHSTTSPVPDGAKRRETTVISRETASASPSQAREQQSTAQPDPRIVEMKDAMLALEEHLRSLLPLPKASSSSSWTLGLSHLFDSPSSSPTLVRLFALPSSSSSSSSSPSSSPRRVSRASAMAKLTKLMKKQIRLSQDEKSFFEMLLPDRKMQAREKNKHDEEMDEETFTRLTDLLIDFETSKYFVGSAATSSSRSRWQAALLLAYQDSQKMNGADVSPRGNRQQDQLSQQKRDRGDELQSAALLVVQMNHMWDIARQLLTKELHPSHIKRCKKTAEWMRTNPMDPLASDKESSKFTALDIRSLLSTILSSTSARRTSCQSVPQESSHERPIEQVSSMYSPSIPTTPSTDEFRPRRPPSDRSRPSRDVAYVLDLLMADLFVKQLCYELCLSGTIARMLAAVQSLSC